MISVVCVYNDEKTLRNVLLKNLRNQTVRFELIAGFLLGGHFSPDPTDSVPLSTNGI